MPSTPPEHKVRYRDLDERQLSGLAAALVNGMTQWPLTLHLQGDLGAGKTTLVRHLLGAMGHEGRVKSPSYGLVEPYRLSGREIYHLDLYRLSDPEELEYLAIRDLEQAADLMLVEWPEHGKGFLSAPDVLVELAHGSGPDLRSVTIEALSSRGRSLLATLQRQPADGRL